MKRVGILTAAILASGWLVSVGWTQSVAVAPIFREVNSDGIYGLLGDLATMVTHLSAIDTNTDALTTLAREYDDNNIILITTATTTTIVPLASGEVIHGQVTLATNGTTTVTGVYGTGSDCGTGQADLFTADLTLADKPYWVSDVHIPAGNGFCLITSAAVTVKGGFEYTQYVP
jgi:hypothetical protein